MFNLRRFFLLDPEITFLNHGSFGATPRPVFRAYQHWQRELEKQPVEFLGRRFSGLMADSRRQLGDYLGTEADSLVYTSNVTVSLNIVARSLELGNGDEVLSTNHEYGALDLTWRFLAKEKGFGYINQPIGVPCGDEDDFVETFWRGVTKRTRVIFMSHITSPTALRFPVERIVERARRQGILTVIDGAHAPGQIPLQLETLGADFYGGNLHKWLCAPKGAGFLYARKDVQALLKPLVVSWGYESDIPGRSRFVEEHEWTGTRDIATFLAVGEAIRFQQEHDWEKVGATCRELAHEAARRVCLLTGRQAFNLYDRVGDYDDRRGRLQMAAARLPETVDLDLMKKQLYDVHRIEIPLIDWQGQKLLRISIQGYNTRQDVDKLLQALETIL